MKLNRMMNKMTRKHRRLVALALILTGVALATAVLLVALRHNVT